MDERERQIRELINNPGFPSGRISEGQVGAAMRNEMLDGAFDRGTAEEMRKQLADQMFMDMRLRGVSKFGGLRADSPTRRAEDVPYSKADEVASQALRMQRGLAQMQLDQHAKEPAAFDPGRADFREMEQIGMPAGKDDYDARVQEIADELFMDGRMEGHPISYEDANLAARDRHNRYLEDVHKPRELVLSYRQPEDTPGANLAAARAGATGFRDWTVDGGVPEYAQGYYWGGPDPGQPLPPGPLEPGVAPARQGPESAASNPYAARIPGSVTGAASPRQPAYDTSTRSASGLTAEAAAEAAAAAALARRRAQRRGNK